MSNAPDKIVFALTSPGLDFYSAMTRVAIASLRITNPCAKVVVAVDHKTNKAVNALGDPIIAEVDEWVMIETPDGADTFRNRYVKISLREVLTGPFLFLDSDILVRGPLAEIFALDVDLAGARNHSRINVDEQIWSEDAKAIEALGWSTRPDVYINGGVIFYGDTDGARRFAAEWMRRWLDSSDKTGRYRDQPALNSALRAVVPRLFVLEDRYNAQFITTPAAIKDAALWHYYSSRNAKPHTTFELLVRDLVSGKSLNQKKLHAAIKSPHPWRSQIIFDAWAADRVIQQNAFCGLPADWLMRRFRVPWSGRIKRLFRNGQAKLGS